MANETLIITQDEIKQALDLNDYISIIEQHMPAMRKGRFTLRICCMQTYIKENFI